MLKEKTDWWKVLCQIGNIEDWADMEISLEFDLICVVTILLQNSKRTKLLWLKLVVGTYWKSSLTKMYDLIAFFELFESSMFISI